jgi:serine protease Do
MTSGAIGDQEQGSSSMKNKTRGFIVSAVAGAGVAVAAMVGIGFALPPASAQTGKGQLIQTTGAPIFAPPPGAPLSFADIVEKVSPAVVQIDVTGKPDGRVGPRTDSRIPGLEGFPFDIPQDGPNNSPPGQPSGPAPQSSGSGFFISENGYIVTNNHVVENAAEIKVVLKDERELKATIVGRDEATDLAVLKVEGSGFAFVNFENAARPRVGDWVIAVGNPFGLGGTATAGIVSAYGRDIGQTFVDFIQIDASINRGNSGGPTFDIYGRVIGVNSAIFSPSGGSVGIGFAIPADVADTVTKQLIKNGKITRGYMGAQIQNLTPDMSAALGLTLRKGAIIADLVPGSPAAKGGVQRGDVVTSVNGKPVSSSAEMTREVARTAAGDTIRLEVLRLGKPETIEFKAGIRPSEAQLAGNDNAPSEDNSAAPKAERPVVLGMSLTPLDAAGRKQFDLPASVNGVVITGVGPNSDAAQKRLQPGDVIMRVGDRVTLKPSDVAAAVAAAKAAGREGVLLLIYRDGRTLFFPIKLEK